MVVELNGKLFDVQGRVIGKVEDLALDRGKGKREMVKG
jgi:sporulation protein YlmC with PRC-barrel domain